MALIGIEELAVGWGGVFADLMDAVCDGWTNRVVFVGAASLSAFVNPAKLGIVSIVVKIVDVNIVPSKLWSRNRLGM